MAGVCWIVQDENGAELSRTEPFDDQSQAEEWMGREWGGLVDQGGAYVVLVEGDRTIYRMGLGEG